MTALINPDDFNFASLDAFADALGGVASKQEGAGLGGRQLMKLDKTTGKWRYGIEQGEINPDDRIAINPASMRHGTARVT